MIDIDLMAEDFDKELNKVKALNNIKKLERFLKELTSLSDNYEIYIDGCECDSKADNRSYGQDRYEVDN